jgi:putative flippase GtrA
MVYKYFGSSKNKFLRQLFSYGIVGLLTNSLGYSLYLSLTYLWNSPKLTMTVLYSSGAIIGFFANRRLTFRHDGPIGLVSMRFMLAHLLGYFLNLSLQVFFVDVLGFAHQLVQALAIFVVAIFLFVSFRYFVFAPQLLEKERWIQFRSATLINCESKAAENV